MLNHTNHTIPNQRWGGIEIRISELKIKLDNNQAGWVSTENLITTVSLKSYLIFDVQVKDNSKVVESSRKY
jgi:hypothetical protein